MPTHLLRRGAIWRVFDGVIGLYAVLAKRAPAIH